MNLLISDIYKSIMIVSKSAPVIRRIVSSRNIALNFFCPQTSNNTLVPRVSPILNLSSGLISSQHHASRWMSNYSSSETIKDPDESEFDKVIDQDGIFGMK